MRAPFSSLSHRVIWSGNRRMVVAGVVVACLLAVAAMAAYVTGHRDHDRSSPRSSTASSSPSPIRAVGETEPTTGSGSVPRPPRISDPLAFSKAAAVMLWSYDTRTTTAEQQLVGMRAWMTPESRYADWASVSAQMPTPDLWARMADQDQHAAATVTEAHYPSAFKQALADDPAAITEAYIYAVTVAGKQTITWAQGGQGAEDRSVTLAVQCRPSRDCTLVAIAPRVAP